MFSCNLPPAFLAECPRSSVIIWQWNRYWNKSAQKVDPGEDISPAAPARNRTCDLLVTSLMLNHWDISMPWLIKDEVHVLVFSIYMLWHVVLVILLQDTQWDCLAKRNSLERNLVGQRLVCQKYAKIPSLKSSPSTQGMFIAERQTGVVSRGVVMWVRVSHVARLRYSQLTMLR